MTNKRIAQTNQQQKSEKPQASGILQRVAVRSVSDAGVQSTDDKEAQPLSNSALSKDFSRVPISTTKPQQIMAKLTIGAVGDKYEQEADRVAAQVVQRINAPASVHSGEDETVQREEMKTKDNEARLMRSPILQRKSSAGGMAATPDLEASINRARGSGQPLAKSIRKPLERFLGADFSRVKVHTDTNADQLNRSIQAKAFTTGQNVFFRQGEYNPGSRRGQELIAHELTHVVQQGAAILPATAQCSVFKDTSDITINNQNQISTMLNTAQLIQRNVVTNGGTWKTDSYQAIEDGAEITLDFEPNENVDAKKIALIQRVLKVERGTNYDKTTQDKIDNNEFTTSQERRKAQRSDGESHIDRDIRRNNPIYGAPDLEDGQELSVTPKGQLDMSQAAQDAGTAQNYQLGWRHRSGKNFYKEKKRSAKLYDRPRMPGATNAVQQDANKKSHMIFETTAVCIKGKQERMYYGSVEWGFRINDGSGSTLMPLRKLTDGVPTAKMILVMRNWNRGEFKDNQPNPIIPIP